MYAAAIGDLEFSLETCRQALAALEQRGMPGDPEELRRGIREREAAIARLEELEAAATLSGLHTPACAAAAGRKPGGA